MYAHPTTEPVFVQASVGTHLKELLDRFCDIVDRLRKTRSVKILQSLELKVFGRNIHSGEGEE